MNILTKYIVKEVLKGSAIAAIFLLTLFMLFAFRDELKDIGHGGYGLKQILMYLALSAPTVFYELLPFGALLGSLFVIGGMANNSEIIAMRAAGISIFGVIKAVMLAGLVMVVIAFLVGEFIATKAVREAQLIKMLSQDNEVALQSKSGVWLREKDEFVNVRKITGKNKLADIYTYKIEGNEHLLAVRHIEKAIYIGHGLWDVNNILQSEISANQVFSSRQVSGQWKTSIEPDLLDVAVVKSDNMSLYDLYMYIDFLKQNNQKSQIYELAFWSRLINPFVIFVMLMVSIPFVVGIKRGVSTGGRMMLGIVIGITFNIFDKIAGHVGLVYGYSPMLMAILPSILVFCSALYAVSRAR
ncbi:MAG: LPS export ABC transporter permease LptG [Methylococcales bacterium]